MFLLITELFISLSNSISQPSLFKTKSACTVGENYHEIESFKPFSESKIWQINRNYYHETGIDAWRDGTVPHNLTSNSMVAKTYAEIIIGFLRDLANQGKFETVYIVELGAGHGRLTYHILRHLEKLIPLLNIKLPPYCLILTDIVEDNLDFFLKHHQLKEYYNAGILDVSYFDAEKSNELQLRFSKKTIGIHSLDQAIIAIGNYFFDSIPTDVFQVQNKEILSCDVSLGSSIDPKDVSPQNLLPKLILKYRKTKVEKPFYEENIFNEILEDYKNKLSNTHVFFPLISFKCIERIQALSKQGLMLLSIDKGFHELHELENIGEPDVVTHGSFSLWNNFHAFSEYCNKKNGLSLLPEFASLYLECTCFLFLENHSHFNETQFAYKRFVNNFGPDDFNALKRMSYQHIAQLNLIEIISILRLSSYDSTAFENMLPRIKQLSKQISLNERNRLAQTLHEVWKMYFTINETFGLAFEIGGLFYDLGYFKYAHYYFQQSIIFYGHNADTYFNMCMCLYQSREDQELIKTIAFAKRIFPNSDRIKQLEALNLNAE